MSIESFVFYCESRFKKEKIEELQSDYDSNLFYNLFQMEYASKTDKKNTDIKAWYELKEMMLNQGNEDQRTDEEIEKDTISKYNELFLNKE